MRAPRCSKERGQPAAVLLVAVLDWMPSPAQPSQVDGGYPAHSTALLQTPPPCRGVVAALRERGLRSVLLTGDNWRTARAIAAQLGIEEVAAEVMPAGKVAKIQVRV